MVKRIIAIILVFISLILAQETYSWEIKVIVPPTSPDTAKIYIAGNFNGWSPGNPDYELKANEDGVYILNIKTMIKDVEFKFTLGTWDKVEVSAEGTNISNRQESISHGIGIKEYKIAAWNIPNNVPSIIGDVRVIDDFEIPQLRRTRRIWIYLPPSYKHSLKRYPIMYMHDGQNLFSDSTSFSGEWGIDETLEGMIAEGSMREMIVVGIENSEYRLSEYSPFDFEYKGLHKGRAKEYGKFIVETLKPFIDKNYRTKRGRKHTAISGSSMGGLVSVYIALEHQDVFSKVGALSSAFGVCREDFVDYIVHTPKRHSIRFWLDLGSVEAEQMQYDVNQQMVVEALLASGWRRDKEVKYTLYDGAEHHERFWRERFGDVLEYLWR